MKDRSSDQHNLATIREVKHDLLTTKHTQVFSESEDRFVFGAPHVYEVFPAPVGDLLRPPCPPLAVIGFQRGPIKENGVNGIHHEDLIAIVIDRLEHFQKGNYASRDNAMAITKLEEAMLWLRKRTVGRENRGVEGTSKI